MAGAAVLLNTTEVFHEAPGRAAQGRTSGASLVARLETARSRIEERFLEGGAALLSILDVLNKLIASLDQLTGSLDEKTANAAMAELQQTVGKLAELGRIETSRQAGFGEISGAQRNMRPHVENMQETMRYLRTFAVTAKITGAGIADFAGFAEEILDRIHAGTQQVNAFGDKLQHLGAGLGSVVARGEKIIAGYEMAIPAIVTDLSNGGADIGAQRKLLAERAERVRKIASGIQGKLASTLSAMQIGDITRQRIEHCQASLTLLDEYLAAEAADLDQADRDNLTSIVTTLVAAQLGESINDFNRDTAKIVKMVVGSRSDLAQIDELRQMLTGESEGDNAMLRLENNVGVARQAVRGIEAVATEAGELSRSTGATVRELIDSVGLLQLVRTDIHYMALNTNLRCGKIGEQGKALNVVTAELRNFAGALDDTAETVLAELTTLEAAAVKLDIVQDGEAQETLDGRLERAMENVRAVGDRMDAGTVALGEQVAIDEMDRCLSRLDFKAELGEVLRACSDEIAPVRCNVPSGTLAPALSDLSGRIARLYTMVCERDVHAAILGDASSV